MIFIKFLLFCSCLGAVTSFILAFFQAKEQRQQQKKKRELFFRKIKTNYSIVKISDDVYYYKGVYLTDKYLIFNDCKIRHYRDFLFTHCLLKSI